MAIDTAEVGIRGQSVFGANNRSIVVDAATYQLKTGSGKLSHVVINNVGSSATLDIYDAASGSAAGKKIFEWVSADGKGTFVLQTPCSVGIRLISGGTFGSAVACWE